MGWYSFFVMGFFGFLRVGRGGVEIFCSCKRLFYELRKVFKGRWVIILGGRVFFFICGFIGF